MLISHFVISLFIFTIDSRYRHKHTKFRQFRVTPSWPDSSSIEFLIHFNSCSTIKRTNKSIHNTVNMMKRKDVVNSILCRPIPGLGQTGGLCIYIAMCKNSALRLTRCATSKDDEGACIQIGWKGADMNLFSYRHILNLQKVKFGLLDDLVQSVLKDRMANHQAWLWFLYTVDLFG